MLLFHLFLGFFSSFLFSLCQSCQFVEEVSVCMHGNFSSSPHSSSSFSCSRRRNCAHVSYLSVHCTSSLAVVRKRTEPFLSERTTRYGIHKTFAIVRMLASTFFFLFYVHSRRIKLGAQNRKKPVIYLSFIGNSC